VVVCQDLLEGRELMMMKRRAEDRLAWRCCMQDLPDGRELMTMMMK